MDPVDPARYTDEAALAVRYTLDTDCRTDASRIEQIMGNTKYVQ